MESDGRRHPVHTAVRERFNTSIIIFLTVCTKDRKPVLGNQDAHSGLIKAWQTKPTWVVGRYVILPDHIHLFCAPGAASVSPLASWVAFWKSTFSRSMKTPGLWQRHFWDTQ